MAKARQRDRGIRRAALGAAALLCLVGGFLSPARLSAQAAPAVRGGGQSLWGGAELSRYSPDFGPSQRLVGGAGYFDLDWNSRYAVEGEARFLRFRGFAGEFQDNYLIGPKVVVFFHGRFRPYAKALVGLGKINFPYKIGSGTYFAIAPGAGVDYRLTRRIALRAEYEYQFWPSAPGVVGEPSNGLKPNGVNLGFAYRCR